MCFGDGMEDIYNQELSTDKRQLFVIIQTAISIVAIDAGFGKTLDQITMQNVRLIQKVGISAYST